MKKVFSVLTEEPRPANHPNCWWGKCGVCKREEAIPRGEVAPIGWNWCLDIVQGFYKLYCNECKGSGD